MNENGTNEDLFAEYMKEMARRYPQCQPGNAGIAMDLMYRCVMAVAAESIPDGEPVETWASCVSSEWTALGFGFSCPWREAEPSQRRSEVDILQDEYLEKTRVRFPTEYLRWQMSLSLRDRAVLANNEVLAMKWDEAAHEEWAKMMQNALYLAARESLPDETNSDTFHSCARSEAYAIGWNIT